MAGMLGAPRRAVLVSITVMVGFLTMSSFAAGLAGADQMVASWYGPGFEGATTASGEPFDPNDYTAAHRTLPFGTKLIVTYNGRSVVVRINDRGPYVSGRDIDLSQAAAQYIGLTAAGEAPVSVETAAASTPTGPYSGAPTAPETSAPQPQAPGQATPQQAPQTETPQAAPAASTAPVKPAAPSQAAPGKGGAQNAGDEQYASADQYEVEPQAAPAPPPPAPVAVPAAPPTPDPSRLETPPAELDTPGSTVERRVVLLVAAPPEPAPEAAAETVETTAAEEAAPTPEPSSKPVPEPAPEPETKPAPKPKMDSAAKVAGISVLPDTGGAPLWALAGGALLAGAGALTFFKMRR